MFIKEREKRSRGKDPIAVSSETSASNNGE